MYFLGMNAKQKNLIFVKSLTCTEIVCYVKKIIILMKVLKIVWLYYQKNKFQIVINMKLLIFVIVVIVIIILEIILVLLLELKLIIVNSILLVNNVFNVKMVMYLTTKKSVKKLISVCYILR